ncbi:MAG: hypothetical protein ACM3VV_02450 [Deltaproteobacteria bacterium]
MKKTFKNVSEDHKNWIYSTVNENGSLIRSYLLNNNNNGSATTSSQQQEEQQNQNNQSDASDLSDLSAKTKNDCNDKKNNSNNQQEKQNNDNNIPLLSVLQAKRSSEGTKKVVIGRIVGRSTNFKVISRSEWKCQIPTYQNKGSSCFYPPLLYMPKNLDSTTGTTPACFICNTFGSLSVIHEYKNAKIIQLLLYRFDSDVVTTISARKNITLLNDNLKNHIFKTIIINTLN